MGGSGWKATRVVGIAVAGLLVTPQLASADYYAREYRARMQRTTFKGANGQTLPGAPTIVGWYPAGDHGPFATLTECQNWAAQAIQGTVNKQFRCWGSGGAPPAAGRQRRTRTQAQPKRQTGMTPGQAQAIATMAATTASMAASFFSDRNKLTKYDLHPPKRWVDNEKYTAAAAEAQRLAQEATVAWVTDATPALDSIEKSPAMLRPVEPPPIDCKQTRKTIERLERGREVQKVWRKRTKALIDAARADRKDAYERARKEARNEMKEILEDAKDEAKKFLLETATKRDNLAAAVKKIKAAKKLPPGTLLRYTKALERLQVGVKKLDELDKHLNNAVKVRDSGKAFEARLAKVHEVSDSATDELVYVLREFSDSGAAKELGLELSGLLGPVTKLQFRLAHLAIVAGADLAEGAIISKRDLPRYQKNLDAMVGADTKLGVKIDSLQYKLRRYCRDR